MHELSTFPEIPREELSAAERRALIQEIGELKQQRQAVILAHNYQIPDVQDIADYVGDSLALSRRAAETDADCIVFCGVHFMAETAAILNPEKTVLLPDLKAGCSLADTITAEEVRQWKAQYPGAVVVAYVNTTAEVKAEADYCCTSSNAVQIVESIPADKEILFLPDLFLGTYVERITGRSMRVWMGQCHVHAGFDPSHITDQLEADPEAELLLHPECGCVSECMWRLAEGDLPQDRTVIVSTGGMVDRVQQSDAQRFLVATEVGIIHQLKKQAPDKEYIPVKDDAICHYMKQITLTKVRDALRDGVHRITVAPDIAGRARKAIERMLATA
ncbi:MAG: quinolinate synthase NadA [Thermaerobacterales bacterium]